MITFKKDSTLVISGGTRGIGKSVVYKFAKAKVNIAFTYNTSKYEAEEIVKDLTDRYAIKIKCYKLNILEPLEYKELFKKVEDDFQRVDFFISNAIISGRDVVGGYAKFMRLKPRGLNNIFVATLTAFVVGSQEATKRMIKNDSGGSIVAISSTGNKVYAQNYAGHASSKSALETMVKYAGMELGKSNIRVNCVRGGPIETDALKSFVNFEHIKDEVIKRSPLNRIGYPDDISSACLFLCSKHSSWITSQTITVDGGTSFR